MKQPRPDIIATITFLPTDAGGRSVPTPNEMFNCLMVIDGRNFDVRLDLESIGSISPGQTAKIPISFLNREKAKKSCSVGKNFLLRELHPIAKGMIDEMKFFDDGEIIPPPIDGAENKDGHL